MGVKRVEHSMRFLMAKIDKLEKFLIDDNLLPWRAGDQAGLDQACKTITESFEDGLSPTAKETKRFEQGSANDWVKRICYRMIELHIHEERFHELEDRISRYERRRRGIKGDPNPFQTGLLAIFAHNPKIQRPSKKAPGEIDLVELMGTHDRERFGKQLFYAYRHFIPADRLARFIAFSYTHRKHSELPNDFIDPLFNAHVAHHLADAEVDLEDRRDYPDAIEKAAAELNKHGWLTGDVTKRKKKPKKSKWG